ncbi:hypothetical protein AYI69_g1818 [Smittium culicis]|uniref:Uncharacterized protein n=1 Tax=Smittium culicis TaxID=133412 RepID=A0A1R1YP76_9FUNG|nr:hypothetical protein AYI69_g1818 [Smittium culicis]
MPAASEPKVPSSPNVFEAELYRHKKVVHTAKFGHLSFSTHGVECSICSSAKCEGRKPVFLKLEIRSWMFFWETRSVKYLLIMGRARIGGESGVHFDCNVNDQA